MTEKNRNALIGILTLATMEGHSLKTRVEVEKLADYLLSEGVVVEVKRGVWYKMYRQYQCSSCGAVIDESSDNRLYGLINFGEQKAHCYWCGSLNDFERKEK